MILLNNNYLYINSNSLHFMVVNLISSSVRKVPFQSRFLSTSLVSFIKLSHACISDNMMSFLSLQSP